MTVRDRIIEYLKVHPEGVDDDTLAIELGLSARQHSNQECRRLEQQGLVRRLKVRGKIRNFLSDGGQTANLVTVSSRMLTERTPSDGHGGLVSFCRRY